MIPIMTQPKIRHRELEGLIIGEDAAGPVR
jgi:hypothetical protein